MGPYGIVRKDYMDTAVAWNIDIVIFASLSSLVLYSLHTGHIRDFQMSYGFRPETTTVVVNQLMSIWHLKLLLTDQPQFCDIHYEIPLQRPSDVSVESIRVPPTVLHPDQKLYELGITSNKSKSGEVQTVYVEYLPTEITPQNRHMIPAIDELYKVYGPPFDYSSVSANDLFPLRVEPLVTQAATRILGVGMGRPESSSTVQTITIANTATNSSHDNAALLSSLTLSATDTHSSASFFSQHSSPDLLQHGQQGATHACTTPQPYPQHLAPAVLAQLPQFPRTHPHLGGWRVLRAFASSVHAELQHRRTHALASPPTLASSTAQPTLPPPSLVSSLSLTSTAPPLASVAGMVPLSHQPFSLNVYRAEPHLPRARDVRGALASLFRRLNAQNLGVGIDMHCALDAQAGTRNRSSDAGQAPAGAMGAPLSLREQLQSAQARPRQSPLAHAAVQPPPPPLGSAGSAAAGPLGVPSDLHVFTALHSLDLSANALPLAPLGALPALTDLSLACNGLNVAPLLPLPACGNCDAGARAEDLLLLVNSTTARSHGVKARTRARPVSPVQGAHEERRSASAAADVEDVHTSTTVGGTVPLTEHVPARVAAQLLPLDASRYSAQAWRLLFPFTPLLARTGYRLHGTGDYVDSEGDAAAALGSGLEGGDVGSDGEEAEVGDEEEDAVAVLAEDGTEDGAEDSFDMHGLATVGARLHGHIGLRVPPLPAMPRCRRVYRALVRRAMKHVRYLQHFSSLAACAAETALAQGEAGLVLTDAAAGEDGRVEDARAAQSLFPLPALSTPSALERVFRPNGSHPYCPRVSAAEDEEVWRGERAGQARVAMLCRAQEARGEGAEEEETERWSVTRGEAPVGTVAAQRFREEVRELQLSEALLLALPLPVLRGSVGFHCLTKLDLSHNGLTPAAVLQLSLLPALEELNLAHNDLDFLPPNLRAFTSLRKLSLAGNRLGGDRRVVLSASDVAGSSSAAVVAGTGDGAVWYEDQYNIFDASGARVLHPGAHGYGAYAHAHLGKVPAGASAAVPGQPLAVRRLAQMLDRDQPARAPLAWSAGHTRQLLALQSLGTLPVLEELDLSENHLSFWPALEQLLPWSLSAIAADADVQALAADWADQCSPGAGTSGALDRHGAVRRVLPDAPDTRPFALPLAYKRPFPRLQALTLVANDVDAPVRLAGLAELPLLRWVDVRGNVFNAALEHTQKLPNLNTTFPLLAQVLCRRGIDVVLANPRPHFDSVLRATGGKSAEATVDALSLLDAAPDATTVSLLTASSVADPDAPLVKGPPQPRPSVVKSTAALQRLLAAGTEDVSHLYSDKQRARIAQAEARDAHMRRSKLASRGAATLGMSSASGQGAYTATRELKVRQQLMQDAIDHAVDVIGSLDERRHMYMHVSATSNPVRALMDVPRVTGTDILHGNVTAARKRLQEQQTRTGSRLACAGDSLSASSLLARDKAGDGSSRVSVILAAEERMRQRRKAEKDRQESALVLHTVNAVLAETSIPTYQRQGTSK